jgi:hypothetical protein
MEKILAHSNQCLFFPCAAVLRSRIENVRKKSYVKKGNNQSPSASATSLLFPGEEVPTKSGRSKPSISTEQRGADPLRRRCAGYKMAAEGTGVPAGGGGEEPLAAANGDRSDESAPTDASDDIASSSAAGDLSPSPSPSPASACLRVWDSAPPAVISCLAAAPCGRLSLHSPELVTASAGSF